MVAAKDYPQAEKTVVVLEFRTAVNSAYLLVELMVELMVSRKVVSTEYLKDEKLGNKMGGYLADGKVARKGFEMVEQMVVLMVCW